MSEAALLTPSRTELRRHTEQGTGLSRYFGNCADFPQEIPRPAPSPRRSLTTRFTVSGKPFARGRKRA